MGLMILRHLVLSSVVVQNYPHDVGRKYVFVIALTHPAVQKVWKNFFERKISAQIPSVSVSKCVTYWEV